MRFESSIKSWNDDRGFGFIEPVHGGREIFVHIKAFNGLRGGRPQPAQRVSFQIEAGPQGKERAVNVELLRMSGRAASRARGRRSLRKGAASLIAIPILLVILLLGYVLGRPPHWVLWTYPVASVLTFAVYAADKAAAKRGAWRTSENTLHTLALVGGWPGALLAQQLLRHKSSKTEFRVTFWITVALNIAAFVFVASPYSHLLPGR